ncbi:quinone oxidoreductase [Pelagibacterium sp. 26DY04]|uniref:quinone oxidoreductase family protein n=1 Tax=unclassified Pelagibacterium TaxID=2623280 RepID=UPI00281519F1|nr:MULTISPECIES: quinone oxidoreductase [unclassified Pelagibacterium]WMT87073.1 quinone oxidoreductase [Pelagibacterium sp. 26DY04]WMT92208.1 quinone oxidoreductase [Pelagibacterium sp. H642]
MKAVVVDQFGGPEALDFRDAEVGQPGSGEILVRHHAIGVNFIDTYHRTGLYPNPLPLIPGSEGAGEVLAVGAGVSEFKPGDRIAYQGTLGSYCQERVMPAAKAVLLPDSIDYETAAAIMLKGLTAYYLLFLTWPVRAGETILFHAAAGGMGLIACQWAKSIGARVIGTAGSPEKVELALKNGCDTVINYSQEDFAQRVRELTNNKGVDVVYDGVGQATFEKSLDCLRPMGLMVSYGNATGPVSVPDLGILARKGSLFVTRPTGAHYFADRSALLAGAKALFAAVESGAVKPHIGQRFALSEAAEAHRALEGRKTVGSTILLP